MRLLPRSRRGTWLLAAAVWPAACAGWWWVLPVVPRAVMTLPANVRLLGFASDCQRAIVARYVDSFDDVSGNSPFGLYVVSVPSGEAIETAAEDCHSVKRAAKEPQRSLWLVSRGNSDSTEVIGIDTDSFNVTRPLVSSPIVGIGEPAISPDGRIAVFHSAFPTGMSHDQEGAVLWDLTAQSLRGIVPNVTRPFAFSHDGRFLAACELSTSNCVRVIRMDCLATATALAGPIGKTVTDLKFNAVGSHLAAEFQDFTQRQTLCWIVATEKLIVDDGFVCARFAAGGDLLVGYDRGKNQLKAFELRAGNREADLGILSENCCGWDIAPDGRTLAVFEKRDRGGIIAALSRRFGMPSPLAPDAYTCAIEMYDATTTQKFAEVSFDARVPGFGDFDPEKCMHWINGGECLATLADCARNQWHICNIPPRKSLTWFAVGAAILALPIALLARRRIRKLKAA